jgi:DNA-binding response OmpR family regulator
MRILVAEADPGAAQLYKLRLGDRGHIVIVTATGKNYKISRYIPIL